MSLTQSTMMALNSPAPAFHLPEADGGHVSLDQFAGKKALVVLFICNHCPYVVHIAPALAALAKKYQEQGVAFVAINSNDADTYPDDSFDKMAIEKQKYGYTFDYVFDEDQSVAKAYNAACTPDIYVFDDNQKLVYRGQFDDTRPTRISSGNYSSGEQPASGADLAKALDVIVSGERPNEDQIPSMGCNIKWKS